MYDLSPPAGSTEWTGFETTQLKELPQGCWPCRHKPHRVKGERAAHPRARRRPQRGCSGGWATHPSARTS